VIEPADHLIHYNNGIAYKNRGMWYMAAQEWEVGVSKKPYELNYLHALGLAYAQLKQPQKASAMLDRAIQIAPDNMQIKESRALIDQMATKK
jgi:tetratricopeptide (TPR) repeat protein